MGGSVKLTVQDYIATVVMDRPPVNAQNSEVRQELIATFDALTDRDDVRVAILTGTGRMFSSGADMKERPDPDHPGEYWHFNRLARECFNAIAECAKPVIAAVNGPAFGAGLGLAASCDIILSASRAARRCCRRCSAARARGACSTPVGAYRPRNCIAPA